jgi:AcrR family transcriptional regulator
MPYRPTERTEARRLAAREAIVGAALAQVAAGGYASASVQAVAARAGVAVGTVYRHFPSKGELFAEVFAPPSASSTLWSRCRPTAAGRRASGSRPPSRRFAAAPWPVRCSPTP